MKKFEIYLQNLEKKQKIMIYLSVVLVAVMLLNQILPPLSSTQEELQTNINSMQMEILNNSTKKLKRDLQKIKEESLKTEEKIAEEEAKVNFLMSSLYKVKFAFFTEVELAKSLDLVLKESVKKEIKINYIKNLDDKVGSLSELIGYKKSMQIDGIGDYKNILGFISFIENLELLFKIYNATKSQDSFLRIHLPTAA